ncbi:MMK1 [Symbiodinium sp. CCMP2592]|nr:MMK1 [Symbiodinium sp. CCMP2592]
MPSTSMVSPSQADMQWRARIGSEEFWATFPPLSPRPEVGSGGIERKAGGLAQNCWARSSCQVWSPFGSMHPYDLEHNQAGGCLDVDFFWAESQSTGLPEKVQGAQGAQGAGRCPGHFASPPAVSHSFSLAAQARSEVHKDLAGHAESNALAWECAAKLALPAACTDRSSKVSSRAAELVLDTGKHLCLSPSGVSCCRRAAVAWQWPPGAAAGARELKAELHQARGVAD